MEARNSGRCVICSNPLLDSTEVTAASKVRDKPELVDPVPKEGSAAAAAAAAVLRKQQPSGAPSEVLKEVIAVDKRLTSLLAFVPLWGPWRLRRSEHHTEQEKFRLTVLSILLTLLLVTAVWMLQPSAEERFDKTRARVGNEIEALRALVESYAAQNRELPDDTMWKRSAESGDLRFYDAWGRLYRYQRKEDGFTIGTYGRDGVEGGYGEDADFFRDFSARPAPPLTPAT